MVKQHLAIVTGGLNEEREISLQSAQYVYDNIDLDKYTPHMIDLQGPSWTCKDGFIDKNDFSLSTKSGILYFDAAILILHGHPAEDGRLQGYFEILGIPYAGCDTFASALTFHKEASKNHLKPYDIPMAESISLRKGAVIDEQQLTSMGFPLFVKPNNYGSSVGISKVNNVIELRTAIELAFEYDNDIMIEAFIDGREFSCGAIHTGPLLHVFPITEIISHNEFFDYEAKYLGASDEVTPADISDELSITCQELTRKIYNLLYCSGVVRVDYIFSNNTFYFLEVNTIPGLSPASIVPQQARAYGWTNKTFVDAIVQSAFNK
jgi:D-alanine-D-alanine ligase